MKSSTFIIANAFCSKSKLLICVCTLFLDIGCKKAVQVSAPDNSITGQNVYSTDGSAAAALTGLYTYMSAGTFPWATGINSISIQCGLSADELTLIDGNTGSMLRAQYQNSLSTQVTPVFWQNLYYFIYNVNAAIEGLNRSQSLTPLVKQQLTGEAKFLRAFCYFYLVNLYGDVPLALTSSYSENRSLSRSPKKDVFNQIITDLQDAQNLLSPVYVGSNAITATDERVRPNKWAASGLLARAYLYNDDWSNAEIQATSLIDNTPQYSLVSTVSEVFLKNSSEAIWQLQPVNSGWNTEDARVLILPPSGPSVSGNPVFLSPFLLSTFEPGDERYTNWVDSRVIDGTTYFYPYKYRNATSDATVTEYLMVLRLSEQFLIRADARVRLGNIAGAVTDINILRNRARANPSPVVPNPLPDLPLSLSEGEALASILHERQVELFTEWGHRWLDLKRTGAIDTVMGTPIGVCSSKGGEWNSNWQLYPIPIRDIQYAPNLRQNQGY